MSIVDRNVASTDPCVSINHMISASLHAKTTSLTDRSFDSKGRARMHRAAKNWMENFNQTGATGLTCPAT